MDKSYIKIAVILTCYNRKQKTLDCLTSLFNYQKTYSPSILQLCVFLTDDGCSDGTPEAVKTEFSNEKITILKGDGNLFWAGGMKVAWNAVIAEKSEYDYYLLVNDDAELLPNCFEQLFDAVEFGEKHFGKKPIVSGIMKDSKDHEEETYGGKVWTNKLLGTGKHLKPIGVPQTCDMAHANVLLIPEYVVDKIGIFYEGYIHGGADHDYSLLAKRNGIPVLVTAEFCGICENDHRKKSERPIFVASLPFKERKAYFNNPRRSIHDHLVYVKRNTPWRLPLVYLGYILTLYVPQFYLLLNKIRHIGK